MENPFEIIIERLNNIENKLDQLQKNKNEDSFNELLTVEEVADYLNYAKASIYGLVHKKDLPYIKTGKKILFKKKDIDSWIEDRKVKTKSEIKKMADDYILKNPFPK